MQLDVTHLEEIPEVSYYSINLIFIIMGVGALVVFTPLLVSSLWKTYPEKPTWVKTTVSVLAAMICVICVVLVFSYALSEMENSRKQNQERDHVISQNQQLVQDQMEQIKHAYDMPGLNLDPTSCTPDTPTQKVEATWPGGYGNLIIGKAAGDHCQVDIFDETGKKLQPVR